jgi:hypothetical protein
MQPLDYRLFASLPGIPCIALDSDIGAARACHSQIVNYNASMLAAGGSSGYSHARRDQGALTCPTACFVCLQLAELEAQSTGSEDDPVDLRINLAMFRARLNQLESGRERVMNEVADADYAAKEAADRVASELAGRRAPPPPVGVLELQLHSMLSCQASEPGFSCLALLSVGMPAASAVEA